MLTRGLAGQHVSRLIPREVSLSPLPFAPGLSMDGRAGLSFGQCGRLRDWLLKKTDYPCADFSGIASPCVASGFTEERLPCFAIEWELEA